MEVLVGPTLGIDVSSPSQLVRDRTGVPAADKVASCLFLKEDEAGDGRIKSGSGYGDGGSGSVEESESSSSIGAPGDSEDDEDEGDGDEVQSRFSGGFASLGSLEDSLPIKRGLSNHFSGKSKSFTNLCEVSSVNDLKKTENPFNKRRRVLIACKLSRKSFYSWQNPQSMPLLAALHEEDEDESEIKKGQSSDHDDDDEGGDHDQEKAPKLTRRKFMKKPSFKSQSCFSLSDLQ